MPFPLAALLFPRVINSSCLWIKRRRRASNSMQSISRFLLTAGQPAADLKAHATIVIRAFPLAQFWHFTRRHTRTRSFPEPFTVFLIDDVTGYEAPDPVCRFHEMSAATRLKCVYKTDDRFRLNPPVLLVIRDAAGVR